MRSSEIEKLEKLTIQKSEIINEKKGINSKLKLINQLVPIVNKINLNQVEDRNTKQLRELLHLQKKEPIINLIQAAKQKVAELGELNLEDFWGDKAFEQMNRRASELLSEKLKNLSEKEKQITDEVESLKSQILPIQRQIEGRESLDLHLKEANEAIHEKLIALRNSSNRNNVALRNVESIEGIINNNIEKSNKVKQKIYI